MKYSFAILLISLLFFASCRFNPNDNPNTLSKTKNPQMALTKVTQKPNDSLLIGTWEVDKFSYDYIEKLIDIEGKKITISIHKEGVLGSANLPNFRWSNEDKPTKLINPEGTWKLNQSYKKDRWQISMSFGRQGGYEYRFAGRYDIYKRNDSLFLWMFIGDPDSGNRLLFQKVN